MSGHLEALSLYLSLINTVVKRARQCLFPLRRLKIFCTGPQILKKFYCCTIESFLTGCIPAWYGKCLASARKALQRVVRTARYITGAELPDIKDLYTRWCQRKAPKRLKDSSHPSHRLVSATARQAVPMHQVWNQQDPEQLLPPSHKNSQQDF